MNNLIAVYSKFILIFLILCYSIFTLFYLSTRSQNARKRVAGSQRFFLYVLHLCGFVVLLSQSGEAIMALLYVLQVAFITLYMLMWRLIYPRSSALVTNNICMLLVISFIIQARLDTDGAFRQFLIAAVAGVFSLILPALMRVFRNVSDKLRWVIGIGGLLSLMLVLAVGGTEYGAKLSLKSIGIPLQPSEFVKISVCFFIAAMLAKDTSFKQVVKTTIIMAGNVLTLVLCKDLGSALIFLISYLLILYIATQTPKYTLAGLGLGAAASAVAYKLFSHVRVRVAVWRDPWYDPTGNSYQVLQALFAVGTAGWFGMGLFGGAAGTIPLAESDFVFAAIAEELGGIFALCLILICFENTIQILWLSSSLRNTFDKILVSGIGIFYGIQVFINVGGVLKIIPSTGVTLPFVSNGGSSVMASFLAFAVIQACFIRSEEREEYERAIRQTPGDEITGFRRADGEIDMPERAPAPVSHARRRIIDPEAIRNSWSTTRGIDYDSFNDDYDYDLRDGKQPDDGLTHFGRRQRIRQYDEKYDRPYERSRNRANSTRSGQIRYDDVHYDDDFDYDDDVRFDDEYDFDDEDLVSGGRQNRRLYDDSYDDYDDNDDNDDSDDTVRGAGPSHFRRR